MDTTSPSISGLAQRLIALEAAAPAVGMAGDVPAPHALRVIEKLRVSLTRLAGVDGFAALLRRALMLARADIPALVMVTVRPDGSLESLDSFGADDRNSAAEAITARLLALLVTFIGEPLVLRLVRDIWPDVSMPSEKQ